VELNFGGGVFDGAARWLDIGVRPGNSNDANDFVTLVPRQNLTPTPNAIYAQEAAYAQGASLTLPYSDTFSSSAPLFSLTNTNPYGTWPAIHGESQSLHSSASAVRGVITSTSPGPDSAAIRGINNGQADAGVGVWGSHDGNGYGVYGTASGDTAHGVHGKATAITGTGVYGEATYSGPARNYGGYFEAAGDVGYGVYGKATSSAGGYGVCGLAEGLAGRGVIGYAENNAITTNYGGYFKAFGSFGRGVYAETTGTNGYAGYFVGGVNYFQGNVGIGTTSPNGNLHIQDAATAVVNIGGNGDTDKAQLGLFEDSDPGQETGIRLEYNGSGNNLNFVEYVTGNKGNVLLTIERDGGVLVSSGDDIVAGNGGGILVSGGGKVNLRDENGNGPIISLDPTQGNRKITTPTLVITGGSDLSEQFDIRGAKDAVKPGMVVSIDPQRAGKLTVSSNVYDKKVAGVISGAGGVKPGMMMGQEGSKADGDYPVALTGRVYCWADASKSAIEPGDLLTTSDTPGHAMKVLDYKRAQGAILGKAMSSLDVGKGLVLVLVTLQ
jgi:hypothetical protein